MCAMQNEEGCVTVTWEIQNFSIFLKEEENDFWYSLLSPLWKVEHTEGSAEWWSLHAWHLNAYIQFRFRSLTKDMPGSKCEMSLVSSCGEVPLEHGILGCPQIGKGTLLGQNRQSLLPKDTLTLRCRMWKNTIQNHELSIYSDLHKVNCLWNIENFDSEKRYEKRIEYVSFLLYVTLKKENNHDSTHVVTFEGLCAERCISFSDCKIYFKDGCGHITDENYSYIYNKRTFYVKIRTKKNTNFSVELKAYVALHKVCNATAHAKFNVPEEIIQSTVPVCDDFLLFFKKKLFCDATLTTEGQSFPAHKLVLAARSPVFRAMFEKRETSESRSGVVSVDDVDGATLERMLVFLYGGMLGEVGWDEAATLYYAADKYDVCALKQNCAEILKAGLTADNVCDAIVLADRHSDQDLMTCVVDFLFDHQEVISSTSWEELEDSQPRLTSKITRQVLFKKGKN